MSPPVEVRTISRLTLKEIYKHSRKMNAKIMPNFESNFSNKLISNFELNNSSDCLSLDDDPVGGKMNFTVYLSNGEHDHSDSSYGNQVNDVAPIKSKEILSAAKCDAGDRCQLDRTTLQTTSQATPQATLQPPDSDRADLIVYHNEKLEEIQPILKPIQQPPVGEMIEITNPSQNPPNEMNLSLKSTLHHALKSNYAYLSFQDSFNIQDYQSFDSATGSTKLAKQTPYLTSLDASFSTSLDTVDILRQLESDPDKQPEIGRPSSKQLAQVLQQSSIDSQTINRSKSSQSIRNVEEGLSTGKESIKLEETAKDVETMKSDNYLYNDSDKRRFQFRSFVDAIRVSDKALPFSCLWQCCVLASLPLQ